MARLTDRQLALWRNAHGENIPVPPAPRKLDNEESRIQQAVIRWWAVSHGPYPEFLLFAIPNGARRDEVVGAILKREGVRRGSSDLFLAIPTTRYHGLFIEMKAPGVGRVTEEQRLFLAEADRRGYAAYACYGYDQAVKLITDYLKGEEFF